MNPKTLLIMLVTLLSILFLTFTIVCDALPLLLPGNHAINAINISPEGKVLYAPWHEGCTALHGGLHDPCLARLHRYTGYKSPLADYTYRAPTIIQMARTETTVPAPVPMPFPITPLVEVEHPNVKVTLPTEHEVLPPANVELPCESEPEPTPYHPAIAVTKERRPLFAPMHADEPTPHTLGADGGFDYQVKKHKVYDPISVVVLKNVGNKALDSDTN